jgi:hypothetical protein
VAEWLRRLTRNQIPSGSVDSSPTEFFRFAHTRTQLKLVTKAFPMAHLMTNDTYE